MLEFYQSYASYEDLMDLTEEMFTTVARELNGSESVTYQGRSVKLSPPWARLTFHESLREIGGVPSEVFESRDHALAFCDENGIEKSKENSWRKFSTFLWNRS